MSWLWSEEMFQYLKDNVEGSYIDELAYDINKKFGSNLTPEQVRSKMLNNKLKTGRGKHYRPMEMTLEQWKYFQENHYGKKSTEVAKMMNEKFGLNLSHEYVRHVRIRAGLKSGVDSKFKKGHTPHNKGKKGWATAGTFKPGGDNRQSVPLYTERIENGYVLMKVDNKQYSKKNWRHKSVFIWELEHGKIPDGHGLIYLDGNPLNCTLENLAMVPLSVSLEMARRELRFNKSELTKVGATVAKLNVKNEELEKEYMKKVLGVGEQLSLEFSNGN